MAARAGARDDVAFSPSSLDLIAPEAAVRPRPALFPIRGDVIDAEFEEITALAPANHTAHAPTGAAGDFRRQVRGFEKPVALSAAAAASPRRFPFSVAVIALSALSFWACGGRTLAARLVPASPETLAIADVTSRIGRSNGIPVAIVNGHVHNGTAERKAVPPIEIRLGTGKSVTVAATADALDPGGTAGFRARLPVPGGSSEAISAVFAEAE